MHGGTPQTGLFLMAEFNQRGVSGFQSAKTASALLVATLSDLLDNLVLAPKPVVQNSRVSWVGELQVPSARLNQLPSCCGVHVHVCLPFLEDEAVSSKRGTIGVSRPACRGNFGQDYPSSISIVLDTINSKTCLG